jgi:hypothetical protein
LVFSLLLLACSSSPTVPAGGADAASGGTKPSPSGGAGGGAAGAAAPPGAGGAGGRVAIDASDDLAADAATSDTGAIDTITDDGATAGCESTPSDDFSSAALGPCWKLLNGTAGNPLITTTVAAGALHLRANGNQNGVWYRTSTKSLVYKELTAANFKVTTTAHPRKATAPTMLPTKDLHVGGVMVRDPASNGGTTESYLFLMVGHSENNDGTIHQGVEFKTTVKGCSDYNEPDWGPSAAGPDADLRICRIGAAFRLYKRVPGDATWTAAMPPAMACPGNDISGAVLTRADLPQTLQVGLALNFSAPSDLDVAFDEFSFVALPADATAGDCTSD